MYAKKIKSQIPLGLLTFWGDVNESLIDGRMDCAGRNYVLLDGSESSKTAARRTAITLMAR